MIDPNKTVLKNFQDTQSSSRLILFTESEMASLKDTIEKSFKSGSITEDTFEKTMNDLSNYLLIPVEISKGKIEDRYVVIEMALRAMGESSDEISKARVHPEGTVRVWGGVSYKKVGKEWLPVKGGAKAGSKEENPVIGKTKSGKNIHSSFDHPDHEKFTAEDHEDARDLHTKLNGKKGDDIVGHSAEATKHDRAMQSIVHLGGNGEKKDPGAGQAGMTEAEWSKMGFEDRSALMDEAELSTRDIEEYADTSWSDIPTDVKSKIFAAGKAAKKKDVNKPANLISSGESEKQMRDKLATMAKPNPAEKKGEVGEEFTESHLESLVRGPVEIRHFEVMNDAELKYLHDYATKNVMSSTLSPAGRHKALNWYKESIIEINRRKNGKK